MKRHLGLKFGKRFAEEIPGIFFRRNLKRVSKMNVWQIKEFLAANFFSPRFDQKISEGRNE